MKNLNNIKNKEELIQTIKETNIWEIENPSIEVQKSIIDIDPYYIKYIYNPSIQLQLMAVKKDGEVIKYIENPSKEVVIEAIKENANVIFLIDNVSEGLIMFALKQNDEYIRLSDILKLKNCTDNVRLSVLRKNDLLIKDIENPSLEIQMYIANKIPYLCKDIKLDISVQQLLIDKNVENIEYIKNPNPEILYQVVNKDVGKFEFIPLNSLKENTEEKYLFIPNHEECRIYKMKDGNLFFVNLKDKKYCIGWKHSIEYIYQKVTTESLNSINSFCREDYINIIK